MVNYYMMELRKLSGINWIGQHKKLKRRQVINHINNPLRKIALIMISHYSLYRQSTDSSDSGKMEQSQINHDNDKRYIDVYGQNIL